MIQWNIILVNIPQPVLWAINTQSHSFFRRHAIVGQTMCRMPYIIGKSSLSRIAKLREMSDPVVIFIDPSRGHTAANQIK